MRLTEAEGRVFIADAAYGKIVWGVQALTDFGAAGSLGTMTATTAWRAITTAASTSPAYRVEDLGDGCRNAPCFPLRANLLNGMMRRSFSTLDLGSLGATEEELAAARSALAAGQLLVSGELTPGGVPGIVLKASQTFVLVLP